MSGRVLALATAFVAFVSLGIGTATAGKLPPAPGGAPLTQSDVEAVLPGASVAGSIAAQQLLASDYIGLTGGGSYIHNTTTSYIRIHDDTTPLTDAQRDIGYSTHRWLEGHIMQLSPSNDPQTGADTGDGSKGTVTDDCVTDYCECNCSDPQACDVTKTETGAEVSRSQKWVAVGSYACDFADQAGVLEVAGASISLDPGDGVVFTYTSDNEWHQTINP